MDVTNELERYLVEELPGELRTNEHISQWATLVLQLSARDLKQWEIGYLSDVSLLHPEFQRFFDHFIIPIRREDAGLVGWAGRARVPEEKSPYMFPTAFRKGQFLFGLDKVRDVVTRYNFAVVVEGFTDVMHLQRVGIPAIAVMGVTFTRSQAIRLRRYCDRVVLMPDGDEVGHRAAPDWCDVCPAVGFTHALQIPPSPHDPRSWLLSKNGLQEITACLRQAVQVLKGAS